MSWNSYWQNHMEGVEQNEERVDRTWAAVLALMLARERWLRRSIVQLSYALPVAPGGYIDGTDRKALRAFRSNSRRLSERFIADTKYALIGRRDPYSLARVDGPRRLSSTGIIPKQIGKAHEDFNKSWEASRRIEQADAPTIIAPPTPQARIAPAPVIPDFAPVEAQADDSLGDEWEMVQDAKINIERNLGYGTFRMLEDMVRRANRRSKPEEVAVMMNGKADARATSQENDGSWRLNRNNMRLSTTAHIRGLHRRRSVSCGLADGHQLYRLDLPKKYLGKIAPSGTVAQHVWQVRPLSEWNDITSKINAGRQTSSSIDTLGLGYGDPSYVTPIPNHYFAQAVTQGKRLRKRYLAAAAIIALSGDSEERRAG